MTEESLAPLLAASVALERRKKGLPTMHAVPGFSREELALEQSTALAKVQTNEMRPEYVRHAAVTFSEDQVRTIRQTVAKDCTDVEFAFFLEVARRSQLDPFRKQIYAVKRGGKVAIQTGIDGFRLIASRTGLYEGQEPAQWCGPDGVWKDVWLDKTPPAAARVGVFRKGFREPLRAVARFSSYSQDNLWQRMPEVMISKVAEALALRKAFPEDLSGLYSDEEMQQADPKPAAPEKTPSAWDAVEAECTELIACAATLAELDEVNNTVRARIEETKPPRAVTRRLRDARDARKARLEAEAKGDADLAAMGTNDAYGMTDAPPATTPAPAATCLFCKEPVGPDAVEREDREGILRPSHPTCTAFGKGT